MHTFFLFALTIGMRTSANWPLVSTIRASTLRGRNLKIALRASSGSETELSIGIGWLYEKLFAIEEGMVE